MHLRCIEMRYNHFLGYIRREQFFFLTIHFRYVDQAQMGQNILKTRTGMTFIEKAKILSWEITSDTCDTKIGSTKVLVSKKDKK